MDKEWIRTSVWIPPELQESPLRRVAEHYIDAGWSLSSVIACNGGLKDVPVQSMLDLPVEERLDCGRALPEDLWVIQLELVKGGYGTRREVRTARFAHSSKPCPWLEHPVEIEVQVAEDIMSGRKRERGQPHEMKVVLSELASLSEATLASWAVVSSSGRGPSLRELLDGERSSYVDLSTVFLSELEFDEHALALVPEHAHKEHWASGWLVSVAPYWGLPASVTAASSFGSAMWRLLSSWARRRQYH